MQKIIIVAFLFAVVAVSSASLIPVPAAGYGFIGGLTKLPNLGLGNIAGVNSNQNTLGYNFVVREAGPVSGRVHGQSAYAPLGVGIGLGGLGGLGGGLVGLGGGLGLGLGGGIIG